MKGKSRKKGSADSAISRTQPDSCATTPTLLLSGDLVMVYVLRDSGCVGRFTSWRVEPAGSGGLKFYDRRGDLVEYFSGTKIKSWCVFGPDGRRLKDGTRRHQKTRRECSRSDPALIRRDAFGSTLAK